MGPSLGLEALSVGEVSACANERQPRRVEFDLGDGACLQLALHAAKQIFSRCGLALQQSHPLPGGGKIKQGGAQLAAHLPGGGGDVEPGRFREMPRLLGAEAALAGSLEWQVEDHSRNPGAERIRDRLIGYRPGDRGIGPLGSGLDAAGGHAPIGSGHFEARVIVERGQREHLEIPLRRWPGGQLAMEILLQERLEVGIVQRAAFQACGRLRRRQRLRVEPGAPGHQSQSDDDWPMLQVA